MVAIDENQLNGTEFNVGERFVTTATPQLGAKLQ